MNRWLWSIVLVVGGTFGLGFLGVAYTSHVQHQTEQRFERAQQANNRRWCALLSSLDQPQVPATTERGRQVQTQIHQLRLGLGCGGTP